MGEIEQHAKQKWKKIMVGTRSREVFEICEKCDPWLNNLQIHFMTNGLKAQKLR